MKKRAYLRELLAKLYISPVMGMLWRLGGYPVSALNCVALYFLLQELMARPLSGGAAWHPSQGIAWTALAWPMAAGFLLRFGLERAARWCNRMNPLEFLDTLEHELTHALWGTLFLSFPHSLKATLRGEGEVQLDRVNPLILWSPYFFPLWTVAAACLSPLLRDELLPIWHIPVFTLFGAFLYRLGRELHWRQSDLRRYGFLFSTTSIAVLLLFFFAALVHFQELGDWSWLGRGMQRWWRFLIAAARGAMIYPEG